MSVPGFVIDNSVVIAWCFEDETTTYTESVLDRLHSVGALVPAIWPLEVGNALLAAERRKRISHANALRFLRLVRTLPIKVEPEGAARAFMDVFPLAKAHQLTTYDASYLDLATRTGIPLATQDKSLIRAAKSCGVAIQR